MKFFLKKKRKKMNMIFIFYFLNKKINFRGKEKM